MAALDEYRQATGLRSRSAAVRHAVRLLRHRDLEQDYAAAWDERESSKQADRKVRTSDG